MILQNLKKCLLPVLVVLVIAIPRPNCAQFLDILESMNFYPCVLKNETLICDASTMIPLHRNKTLRFFPSTNHKITEVQIINFLTDGVPGNLFSEISANLLSIKIRTKVPLKTIDSQTFLGCKNTIFLEISGPESSDATPVLMDQVFSPLLSLEELKLMNLNLPTLTATSFSTLPTLKSLTVQTLVLDSISPDTFQNNKNLTHLTLSGVRNSTALVHVLETWPSSSKLAVKSLSINNCNLRSFPRLSQVLAENLVHLSLAKNPLEQILPGDVEFLTKLEVLSLASTKLRRDSLSGLKVLSQLKDIKLIDVTTLADLPVEIESMTLLESIYLDMSRFESISISLPESIRKISATNLQKPSQISSNLLRKCKNLSVLHLFSLPMDNILFLLENAKVFQESLTVLSLDNTSILKDRLLEFLAFLGRLEVLYLNSANIDSLPDKVLVNMRSLKKLMLLGNHLRYESLNSVGFQNLTSHLTDLDLSKNQLTSLPPCMFHNFSNFAGLSVQDNSFICDCRLSWLHDIVSRDPPGSYPNLNFTCFSGPNDGKFFLNLSAKDLRNCSSTNVLDNCTPSRDAMYQVPYLASFHSARSILSVSNVSGSGLRFMFDYFTLVVKESGTTVHSDLDKYDMTRAAIDVSLASHSSSFSSLRVCLVLYRNKIEYMYDYNCRSVSIAAPLLESKLTIMAALLAAAGTCILIIVIAAVLGCRKWKRKYEKNHEYCEASSTEYSEPDETYKNNDEYTYISHDHYSVNPEEDYVEESVQPTEDVPAASFSNRSSKLGTISTKSLDVLNLSKTSSSHHSSKFRKRPPILEKISRARSSSNIHDRQRMSLPSPGADSIKMHNIDPTFTSTLPRQYISRALPHTPSTTGLEVLREDIPPPKPRLSASNIQSLLDNCDHHLNLFSKYISNTSLCTDESANHPHSGDSGLGVSKVSNQLNHSLSDGNSVII